MNRRGAIKTLPFLGLSLMGSPLAAFPGESKSRSLCLEYLDQVIKLLEKIRDFQGENLLKASENIARTYKSDGKCFCQWETGHSFDGDMFPDRPGDTDLFIMGYTMGTPPVQPKKGDLLLINVIRKPLDEDIDKKGFFIIGGPNSWCGDIEHSEQLTEENQKLLVRKYSNIWIETYINLYSALIYLPGETAPTGPTSGALNMATYWAMTADAVRLLAAEGVSVKVKGDGPQLPQNTPRVNLRKPLVSAYINEIIREIRRINTEMDTLNRVAGEAADRILSGGKLFVYSRYREALSSEASAKRGGLALLNTTFADDPNFKGTDKDYMIMGVYRPDYSVDIRMLKKFRDAGMKISSIGPSTINGKKPSGKTIADETDFHLGGCDTGGFFAMPGLDKKVCPTSGIIITLIFWACMIQLAEEIIKRTGNTPGVLSSGAFKGGAEQRANRTEMVKKRGY
ncbi:MAG: hypothetical protein Q8O92_06490 [Candidatus Latescibacter sp.]|nr:hypothetical protein [Candidatus Latescibacter sp.]